MVIAEPTFEDTNLSSVGSITTRSVLALTLSTERVTHQTTRNSPAFVLGVNKTILGEPTFAKSLYKLGVDPVVLVPDSNKLFVV